MMAPSYFSSVVLKEKLLFGPFCSVSRAAFFSVLNAYRIKGTANDVIPNSWQVFHPSTADEDNRVLLEVVANPGNIGGYFDPIG
jgi:hypothetical protein